MRCLLIGTCCFKIESGMLFETKVIGNISNNWFDEMHLETMNIIYLVYTAYNIVLLHRKIFQAGHALRKDQD